MDRGEDAAEADRERSIADPHRAVYHLGVRDVPKDTENAAEPVELQLQIDQLERELERHRAQEHLLAETLISATRHATVVREDARREAEVALRKARRQATQLKARAERERDAAKRELLRLHRITEQMRNGLSQFLMAKVDELQVELDDEPSPQEDDELQTALGSALRGQSDPRPRSSSAPRR
jgi:cell division septum initiation protein DivIVA